MGHTTVCLVRFSPAWFIFMMGLTAVSMATLSLCFIAGEAVAIHLLAIGGTPI